MSGQPKGTKPNPRTFPPLLAAREAFLRQLVVSGSPGARAELNMYESWRRSFDPHPPKQKPKFERLMEQAQPRPHFTAGRADGALVEVAPAEMVEPGSERAHELGLTGGAA